MDQVLKGMERLALNMMTATSRIDRLEAPQVNAMGSYGGGMRYGQGGRGGRGSYDKITPVSDLVFREFLTPSSCYVYIDLYYKSYRCSIKAYIKASRIAYYMLERN